MPKSRTHRPGHHVYKEYLDRRETGLLGHRGSGFLGTADFHNHTYRNLLRCLESPEERLLFPNIFDQTSYVGKYSRNMGPTGGIFNLEFNPDGSLLAAACERRNVLLFDPISRKIVSTMENAHEDCVNCVRFLDSRSFATCSDDTTVALWDARYLKYKVRTLKGHSNWVKNIEYSFKENLLVTSGFDGAIHTWDINKYSENDMTSEYSKVFYTSGLMRMRLTPDANQMLISTRNGYLLVIHDLSLSSLKQDLRGFQPNMYRFLKLSGKSLPIAVNFAHMFRSTRNRVEIVSDFAPSNDAEIISSLQVHPQGWVAVSRNISSDDRSEWCCVHDIHSYPLSPEDGEEEDEEVEDRQEEGQQQQRAHASNSTGGGSTSNSSNFARLSEFLIGSNGDESNSAVNDSVSPSAVISINVRTRNRNQESGESRESAAVEEQPAINYENFGGVNLLSSDSLTILEMLTEFRQRSQNLAARAREQPSENIDSDESEFLLIAHRLGSNVQSRVLYFGSPSTKNAKVHKNTKRLTHYIEESNTGRGFIKEVSFSSDGRVICSPYGHGIRLLAFDSECSELNQYYSMDANACCSSLPPKPLVEVGIVSGRHSEVVLSSAFSPHHFLLVSGCLAGKISWYQPIL